MDDTILAERDIARLLAEYCHFIDDGNFAGLLGCFTEDAEFVFAGRVKAGRAAMLRFFEKTSGPDQRGKHVTANTIVDIDGDRARAASDFVFLVRVGDGLVPLITGRYSDEACREGGRWRLTRREVTTL